MNKYSGFEELIQICKQNAVWFDLNYSEVEDIFEFKLHSSAKEECGYIKRAFSIQQCIDLVNEKTKRVKE